MPGCSDGIERRPPVAQAADRLVPGGPCPSSSANASGASSRPLTKSRWRSRELRRGGEFQPLDGRVHETARRAALARRLAEQRPAFAAPAHVQRRAVCRFAASNSGKPPAPDRAEALFRKVETGRAQFGQDGAQILPQRRRQEKPVVQPRAVRRRARGARAGRACTRRWPARAGRRATSTPRAAATRWRGTRSAPTVPPGGPPTFQNLSKLISLRWVLPVMSVCRWRSVSPMM